MNKFQARFIELVLKKVIDGIEKNKKQVFFQSFNCRIKFLSAMGYGLQL